MVVARESLPAGLVVVGSEAVEPLVAELVVGSSFRFAVPS